MAHHEVIEAFRRRLEQGWDKSPVVYPNTEGEVPMDGSPWLALQFPVSNVIRLSVSSPYYREEGGARFVLMLPRGEGTARAMIWAGELARLFRYQEFDDVKTQTPGSPVIDDDADEGLYFVAALVVPYTYDFVDEA